MRKLIWLTVMSVLLFVSVLQAQPNTLTLQEKEQGWQLLFDGKTADGWKSNRADKFPEKGWEIQDGALVVLAKQRGGDIVTEKMYGNFEFALEFKLTERANSGIKYFVQPNSGLGCEYQVLDDEHHPDAKNGVNGNRQLAALYDIIPAHDRSTNPVGEWNQAKIVVQDGHVEHWLNGTKVLEYDRFSPCFKQLLLFSKFKEREGFAMHKKGHLLLQDHGDTVYYRSIKIRPLN